MRSLKLLGSGLRLLVVGLMVGMLAGVSFGQGSIAADDTHSYWYWDQPGNNGSTWGSDTSAYSSYLYGTGGPIEYYNDAKATQEAHLATADGYASSCATGLASNILFVLPAGIEAKAEFQSRLDDLNCTLVGARHYEWDNFLAENWAPTYTVNELATAVSDANWSYSNNSPMNDWASQAGGYASACCMIATNVSDYIYRAIAVGNFLGGVQAVEASLLGLKNEIEGYLG